MSNLNLREQVHRLEQEKKDLKRQLEKDSPQRTSTDLRISKAKSETDLSAKYGRKYTFSTRNDSLGLGSSRYQRSDPNNDDTYRPGGRPSALTNGDLSPRRSFGKSAPSSNPYIATDTHSTRRRFGSVGDESDLSDMSDLDHAWQNEADTRHRTFSSESSTSSLFSTDHDFSTYISRQPTTGYPHSPRVYSPGDYAPVKKRTQRPHSYHGGIVWFSYHGNAV